MLRAFIIFFQCILLHPAYLLAQPNFKKNISPYPLFFTFQPLSILEVPKGGFKFGAEKIVHPRLGIESVVGLKFINYTKDPNLQPGEKNTGNGFLFYPQLNWYMPQKKLDKTGFRNTSAFSLRLGASYITDAYKTWTNLRDANGNGYQKLTYYERHHKNMDMAILYSAKLYFSKLAYNNGIEIFTGLGVRNKVFTYKKLSPELNPNTLRANDESTFISLDRNGNYPLVILGCKLFFRKEVSEK